MRTYRVSDLAQQFVGSFATQATIDSNEIGHADKHQGAAARVLVIQDGPQGGDKVVTVRQSRERVEIGFAPDRLEPGRLFVEHGSEALHGGIHCLGELVQFRDVGFRDPDKATTGDGHGLVDHGLQGAAQTTQNEASQIAAYEAGQGQGCNHFLRAGP